MDESQISLLKPVRRFREAGPRRCLDGDAELGGTIPDPMRPPGATLRKPGGCFRETNDTGAAQKRDKFPLKGTEKALIKNNLLILQ